MDQQVMGWFFTFLLVGVFAEFIKGLSANGTPPVLQKLPFQMTLARVMWTNILAIRLVVLALLVYLFITMPGDARMWAAVGAVPLGLIWWGIYWVFNRYWVGKFKFLPITQKTFLKADENKIPSVTQVLGIDHNGEQKAYPVAMVMYHHQIADEVGGKPIWPTYCGLCRSGRIYDRELDGKTLEFDLVGAITFNAVFADKSTGSWWRQETGEAAKGPMKGRQLVDMMFEQMTLENWLLKHPDSLILQHDPAFKKKYMFANKMLEYEASAPAWHMQPVPPLVIGVDLEGGSKAYDWDRFVGQKIVQDGVGGQPILLVSDEGGTSGFVFDRSVDGETLEFEIQDGAIKDLKTGSKWDIFGRATDGEMAGKALTPVQSYKQNARAWISFHPRTEFYDF